MSRKVRFSKEGQSSLIDFLAHRSAEPQPPVPAVTEEMPKALVCASRTDVGKVRKNNQDSLVIWEQGRLFGVADGMGGHKGGEIASAGARDALLEALQDQQPSVAALRAAIEEANLQLYHQQEKDESLTGMGTTLSVIWMNDTFAYIGHVGDSRVYLLRNGELTQKTFDHSLVEEMVRAGMISEEEAQNHPMKNIITRAVGTDEEVLVDVTVEERKQGDIWLICSDGLHGMVSNRQLGDILRLHAPEKAADMLLQAALDAGGRDNVTLAIVYDGEERA